MDKPGVPGDPVAEEKLVDTNDLKITLVVQFVKEGTKFLYNRLIEDLLTHLFKLFKCPKKLIPQPRYPENAYVHVSTINSISEQIKFEQVMCRLAFSSIFESKKADETMDVSKLADLMSDCMELYLKNHRSREPEITAIDRFSVSVALAAELGLFCISKNRCSNLKKLSRAWMRYFENTFKRNFEDEGGLTRVFTKSATSPSRFYAFLEDFIPKHAVPYKSIPLHVNFYEYVNLGTAKRKEVKEKCSELETLRKEVFSALNIRYSPQDESPGLSTASQGIVDENIARMEYGLGILPHEVLVEQMLKSSPPADSDAPKDGRDEATIKALALSAERKKARKAGIGRDPRRFRSCKTIDPREDNVPAGEHLGEQDLINLAALQLNPTSTLICSSSSDSQTTTQSEVLTQDIGAGTQTLEPRHQGARPKTRSQNPLIHSFSPDSQTTTQSEVLTQGIGTGIQTTLEHRHQGARPKTRKPLQK